jgi:hypothetical protein
MEFIDFERKKNEKGGRLGRRMGRCRYKFPYKQKEKKKKKILSNGRSTNEKYLKITEILLC